MNGSRFVAALAAIFIGVAPSAAGEDCLNPDALGTFRTFPVDPAVFPRVGTMQYPSTLPLGPKEVVLTFDDGPMPPMTNSVLASLRAECVRATFFLVGRNAKAHPSIVQRIAREGHTVANHTENHHLVTLAGPYGIKEFDTGFATIRSALEPAGYEPAPFFRFPGLLNTHAVENHAKAKAVSIMSADLLADDWVGIGPEAIIARGLTRLQAKGQGIFLLHDVQPALALALPKLLRELKTRGYRIVHIVPAPGTGAPPHPLAAPPVAEQKPLPATAVRRAPAHAVSAAAKEPEVSEFVFFSRWRKMMEQHRTKPAQAVSASYPPNESGGH